MLHRRFLNNLTPDLSFQLEEASNGLLTRPDAPWLQSQDVDTIYHGFTHSTRPRRKARYAQNLAQAMALPVLIAAEAAQRNPDVANKVAPENYRDLVVESTKVIIRRTEAAQREIAQGLIDDTWELYHKGSLGLNIASRDLDKLLQHGQPPNDPNNQALTNIVNRRSQLLGEHVVNTLIEICTLARGLTNKQIARAAMSNNGIAQVAEQILSELPTNDYVLAVFALKRPM